MLQIKLGDECLLMEFGEYINEVILIPLHDLDFNRLELGTWGLVYFGAVQIHRSNCYEVNSAI